MKLVIMVQALILKVKLPPVFLSGQTFEKITRRNFGLENTHES
jgi:hypothetical protein